MKRITTAAFVACGLVLFSLSAVAGPYCSATSEDGTETCSIECRSDEKAECGKGVYDWEAECYCVSQ